MTKEQITDFYKVLQQEEVNNICITRAGGEMVLSLNGVSQDLVYLITASMISQKAIHDVIMESASCINKMGTGLVEQLRNS
jgi:hypothetical protein